MWCVQNVVYQARYYATYDPHALCSVVAFIGTGPSILGGRRLSFLGGGQKRIGENMISTPLSGYITLDQYF